MVKIDEEKHLRVILATNIFDQDSGSSLDEKNLDHYRGLWEDISKQLGCDPSDILDFDLCFADSHSAELVGVNEEFISSARLDNLFSVWASVNSLTQASKPKEDSHINVAALFDHEEVGSTSITGANSGRVS